MHPNKLNIFFFGILNNFLYFNVQENFLFYFFFIDFTHKLSEVVKLCDFFY